jgi:hypothetical protein
MTDREKYEAAARAHPILATSLGLFQLVVMIVGTVIVVKWGWKKIK